LQEFLRIDWHAGTGPDGEQLEILAYCGGPLHPQADETLHPAFPGSTRETMVVAQAITRPAFRIARPDERFAATASF